jgi:hypothetical protein
MHIYYLFVGMYCLNMLAMALEIAMERPAYEDIATKVFLSLFSFLLS